MDFFAGLLGRGVVSAAEDGSLQLDDVASAAGLHHAPRPGRVRCFCAACVSARDKARVVALPSYLSLLLEEDPLDLEEIARVRAALPKLAPPTSRQPWQPRPPRNGAVAGENDGSRPAA